MPDRYKRRAIRFTPAARPTISQVYQITAQEAVRWGISAGHLIDRISCESGGRWWAANGQYRGLGQFAYSTFTRGLSTMPRRVAFKRSRVVWRPTRIVRTYSDGKKSWQFGYKIKVRRTRIYRGRLPRWPEHTHGHSQVRIMAQAMAGRSAVNDSEWQCR